MKRVLLILMLAGTASAQVFLLWDSSVTNEPPRPRFAPAVDISNPKHPDWRPEFRKVTNTPAYYNVDSGACAATLDGLETEKTNTFTAAQRQGYKELRDLKQLMGLPNRASDIKLLRVLLENSSTNASATATRRLAAGTAAYILQENKKGSAEE